MLIQVFYNFFALRSLELELCRRRRISQLRLTHGPKPLVENPICFRNLLLKVLCAGNQSLIPEDFVSLCDGGFSDCLYGITDSPRNRLNITRLSLAQIGQFQRSRRIRLIGLEKFPPRDRIVLSQSAVARSRPYLRVSRWNVQSCHDIQGAPRQKMGYGKDAPTIKRRRQGKIRTSISKLPIADARTTALPQKKLRGNGRSS